MDVVPDSVAWSQREDRLRVVRPVIEREDLLGDGMQRDEGLDAGLDPLLADVAPTLGGLSDVVRVERLHVRIGKSRQAGEEKHPADQLQPRIRLRVCQQTLQILAADGPMARRDFLLVRKILQRIASQDLPVDGDIGQTVEPGQAAIDVGGAALLRALQVEFEGLPECLGQIPQREILLAAALQEASQVALHEARLTPRGGRADPFGTARQPLELRFARCQQGHRNRMAPDKPLLQHCGAHHALLLQHLFVGADNPLAKGFQMVVLPG